MDIESQLKWATQQLESHSESPQLDAELLLCHILDKSRTYLRAWPEKHLDSDTESRFRALIAARAEGRPVAHLIGQREFWSLALKVTADTLIPRPDTETLVESALTIIPVDAQWTIADLGTGSGAISLAIAHERPACHLIATDRSEAALSVAQQNAERHAINNIEFRLGSWCTPLQEEQYEMILSNPPYIEADDPHLHQGDVRFEPLSALASGSDGLDDIRQIAVCALNHLKPNGHLCLEHGYNQAEPVHGLLTEMGYANISQQRDLGGHIRTSCGQKTA
ncbi:protein-(glutamine-N5) methyltransferase, release factor-specific [Solemya pervernicosa gill symbiont]|uniref:Release factor glutamine methyltransferase n=2 Tax=Gammaproteobacteria incertae sedis TaxID=118884 RepID=A0A1T2L0K9_9GAMM|nr:peptide chain release factor N(5)-glutamine methyltransferase [Candidatus Reidiella endopervernicosa]OOZ38618.1 protein-(glutamine-N5) methyltransferase, release factor-specific [Solemya pervernicosa gill symbiont]QKQ25994.1 peptide chain release factor N(5)-glutamine methyltransferase [Candidatus Reidiella endopervernicosa]